jgi:hypothetical protein
VRGPSAAGLAAAVWAFIFAAMSFSWAFWEPFWVLGGVLVLLAVREFQRRRRSGGF